MMINPINHFDQAINIKIVNTIGLLIKKFSVKNLCLLAVLLGMGSIKQEIINMLPNVTKTLYSQFSIWCKFLYRLVKKNLDKSKQVTGELETPKEEKTYSNKFDILFSANNVFIKNLYMMIIRQAIDVPICENRMSQEGREKYKKQIILGNTTIIRPNLEINIKSQFHIDILAKFSDLNDFDIVRSDYVDYTNVMSERKGMHNIFQLLPMQEFYEDIHKYRECNCLSDEDFYENDSYGTEIMRLITIAVHNKYKLTCLLSITMLDIEIMFNAAFPCTKNDYNTIRFSDKVNIQKPLKIFGVEVDISSCTSKCLISCGRISAINTNNPPNRQYEFVKEMITECFKYNSRPELKDGTSYEVRYNETPISLRSNDNTINLREEWISFLDELNSSVNYENEKNNINIWDMKVVCDKKIITKASPKTIINVKNADGEDEQKIIDAVKEVSQTITTISFENVNSTYKDFSTLYLKEHDDRKLSSTLNTFKYKKSIYKELGLPYKFGVMLYGEPGCGKSSAILAIASYLQKDIYYIDLSNITTNNDLKSIFNKVNSEVSKGGIIVMEDIDVMTNIVHDRALNNYENTDLTLECFLNLLQGSLTKDGSIFITTTNNIDILDPAFIRDGRFDVKINLTACDHYQMNQIYKKFFNRTIPVDLIAKIPESTITPATFISKLTPFILSEVDDKSMVDYILA